jgi:hypothetical protein
MSGKGKSTLRQRQPYSESANYEHEETQDDEHANVVYQNPVRDFRAMTRCLVFTEGFLNRTEK